jgi:hypothetical protein
MNNVFTRIFNSLRPDNPGAPTAVVGESSYAGAAKEPLAATATETGPTEPPVELKGRRAVKTGPPGPAKFWEQFDTPPASNATIRKVLDETGTTAATPAEIQTLTELQSGFDALRKFLIAHLPSAAEAAFHKHKKVIGDLLAAGKLTDAAEQDWWTLSDWEREYSGKRNEADRAQRQISAQAWPVISGIVDRVCTAAQKLANQLEADERAEADSWSVQFVPSRKLATISQIPKRIEFWKPVQGTVFSPGHILEVLGIK